MDLSFDQKWQVITERDKAARGRFICAVKTTGIYCQPGCPARTPNRENVEFFATCHDASEAGYRSCLRCHPDRITEQVEYQHTWQ